MRLGRRDLLAAALPGASLMGRLTGAHAAETDGRRPPIASVTPLGFGARLDGVTDDARAINAALASGVSVVTMPMGATAAIGSTLHVPPGVSLIGQNATFKAVAPIVMLALEARAGDLHGNRDGRLSGFTLDGDGVAVEGLSLGLVVSRSFADITVIDIVPSGSAGSGGLGAAWVLDGSQNNTFVNCGTDRACGVALLLLNGAGGNSFVNGEFCFGRRNNVRLDVDAGRPGHAFHHFGEGAGPTQNTFVGCRFEYGAAPESCALVAGGQNTFADCVFVADGPAGSQIAVAEGASVNAFIRPKIFPGGPAKPHGLVNHGFETLVQDGYFEGFPDNTVVMATSKALVIRGAPHLSSPTYRVENLSGDAARNFRVSLPPLMIGPGDVAALAGQEGPSLPGMMAINDAGRTWVRGKENWRELQAAPEPVTLDLPAAPPGRPMEATCRLPGPAGTFLVNVTAATSDGVHGRGALFVVRVRDTAPGRMASVQKIGADDAWGHDVESLAATVSSQGDFAVRVVFATSADGTVVVEAQRAGGGLP